MMARRAAGVWRSGVMCISRPFAPREAARLPPRRRLRVVESGRAGMWESRLSSTDGLGVVVCAERLRRRGAPVCIQVRRLRAETIGFVARPLPAAVPRCSRCSSLSAICPSQSLGEPDARPTWPAASLAPGVPGCGVCRGAGDSHVALAGSRRPSHDHRRSAGCVAYAAHMLPFASLAFAHVRYQTHTTMDG